VFNHRIIIIFIQYDIQKERKRNENYEVDLDLDLDLESVSGKVDGSEEIDGATSIFGKLEQAGKSPARNLANGNT
jgi:hypothetical protein